MRPVDGGEDTSSASSNSNASRGGTGGDGGVALTVANISRIPTNANLALEETNSRDSQGGWHHRAQVHVGQRNGAGPPPPPKELTHHVVGSSRRVSAERSLLLWVSEKRI